ncbi:flagellin [Neorhizobium sp. LjRoot104]|uniref:flagellin N-terminal helical domain-containing protein n=1 Tax=Neorhizobium sp. LjRoot104 TaxID=3342254 RepID=UPI003ECF2652
MTSLLTNISAMSALQTLRQISGHMEETQRQVSTGQRVSSASDNAAYWSIATTMRSDNGALSAVQDALGLGAAKVDTAYAAMESSIDVLQELKNKLVAASESGVDRAKVQEEISQLQDQLRSIASSASFSGENWLQAEVGGKFDSTSRGYVAGTAIHKSIVGSFTRDASGNVALQTVDVKLDHSNVLFDLSGGHGGILDQGILVGVRNSGHQDTAGADIFVPTIDFNPNWTLDGTVAWDDVFAYRPYVQLDGAWVVAWPDMGVWDGDSIETSTRATVSASNYENEITVATFDITKMDDYKSKLRLGTNATDDQVIATLLPFVDRQLEKLINAAAKLGSAATRIALQDSFVSKLTDSFTSGVGRLVDADMNEASSRLKALQTQQQLATQSLSIANAGAENIVSLFR